MRIRPITRKIPAPYHWSCVCLSENGDSPREPSHCSYGGARGRSQGTSLSTPIDLCDDEW